MRALLLSLFFCTITLSTVAADARSTSAVVRTVWVANEQDLVAPTTAPLRRLRPILPVWHLVPFQPVFPEFRRVPSIRMPAIEARAEWSHFDRSITSALPSWFTMCKEYPGYCSGYQYLEARVRYDRSVLDTMVRVNRAGNKRIKPVTDEKHYGWKDGRYVHTGKDGKKFVDRLGFGEDGKGDCDDYALAKQRDLRALGWPRTALLLTIVRTSPKAKQHHLVLVVRTTEGDFVLDNLTQKIVKLEDLKYVILAQQMPDYEYRWRRYDIKPPNRPTS